MSTQVQLHARGFGHSQSHIIRPACPSHSATQTAARRTHRRVHSSQLYAVSADAGPRSKEAALKAWVETALHDTPSAQTVLANLPDLKPQGQGAGGYEMVTSTSVNQGQALVCVPKSLMITFETAKSDPEYGPLVLDAPLTEWQALVLALLVERARGRDSQWAPYMAMLPDQDDHPLSWGEDRLAWLKGSPMGETLRNRQNQVRDDCETLEIAGANELPTAVRWSEAHQGEPLVSVTSVTWAAATLLSRAFSLDLTAEAVDSVPEEEEAGDDGWQGAVQGAGLGVVEDSLCVVPWADSLNHCSAAGEESCLRWQPELQAATLCAHRAYEPGEQVFDSYGPNLSPTDLLLDYGYSDQTNTNHRVDIDLTQLVAPTSKQARTLLKALAQVHLGSQGSNSNPKIALGVEGPDMAMLSWVRAGLSTDAELIRAGWRVKATEGDVELACRVMGRLSEPSSVAMETKVLDTISQHLSHLLQQYPSLDSHPGRACKGFLAVEAALTSEQSALRGALEVIAHWQEMLRDGCPVEDLYYQGDDEDEDYDEDQEDM